MQKVHHSKEHHLTHQELTYLEVAVECCEYICKGLFFQNEQCSLNIVCQTVVFTIQQLHMYIFSAWRIYEFCVIVLHCKISSHVYYHIGLIYQMTGLAMRYQQWSHDHYVIVILIGQFDLVGKTNHSKI